MYRNAISGFFHPASVIKVRTEVPASAIAVAHAALMSWNVQSSPALRRAMRK
jgi:hypothetical protein